MTAQYVRVALDRELSAVRECIEGSRATTLFGAAKSLGGFVASAALDHDDVFARLLDAAVASGLSESAARSHISRGLRRGAMKPRDVPGLSPLGREVVVPLPPTPARKADAPAPILPDADAVWESAIPVTRDAEVSAWLESRGLDPDAVALWDLARAIPHGARLPRWAWSKKGGRWTASGHRVVVRVWNAAGRCGALRARCIRKPAVPAKSLAPAGTKVSGLVMACPLAVQILQGTCPDWWTAPSFVITEGEPDWWTWASRQPDACEDGPAVIGVESGSWTQAIADRIPDGALVAIRTHHDSAGDLYARRIARTLAGRCEVFRSMKEDVQ